jgi:hypothetical protein
MELGEENHISNDASSGNANLDAGLPSVNATTPEPNESGPTIISICNPLTEDSGIRQHCPSKVFCLNPNAVQVPSWVKDSKCKPFVTGWSFRRI